MMAVPEIRFKGFTDDWEQRELGEVAEFNPRSVLPVSFEYVDLESVVGTSLIAHRTEKKDTAPSRAQRLAKKGDVFYQTVRPYQKNNFLFDMDFDNYVFSTGYAQLRPQIDSYFLFYKLQEEKFVAEVLDNCTGTSYPAINSTDLSHIKVDITLVTAEQAAIVNFFCTLDDTITLHKRKLDSLKELKRGYVQQMFPQAGERVPRLRFAGFREDWRIKELKEMADYKNGKGHEDKQVISGKYELVNLNSISIDGGLKPSGKFIDSTEETLLVNDLVMILSDVAHGNLLGRVALIPHNDKYVLNQRVALLRPKRTVNALFMLYNINAHQLYFKQQGAGMSQLNISKSCVEDFQSYVPANKEEQELIGNFFRNLDEQIAAQQIKLDKLKQLKAAYLQRMFV